MKRAKVLLVALTFVGIVGGSLAFTAQKFGTKFVYQKSGSTCPLKLSNVIIGTGTNTIGSAFTATTNNLDVASSLCTNTYTYTVVE